MLSKECNVCLFFRSPKTYLLNWNLNVSTWVGGWILNLPKLAVKPTNLYTLLTSTRALYQPFVGIIRRLWLLCFFLLDSLSTLTFSSLRILQMEKYWIKYQLPTYLGSWISYSFIGICEQGKDQRDRQTEIVKDIYLNF